MDINIIFVENGIFQQEILKLTEFEIFVSLKSLLFLTKKPIEEYKKDSEVILSREFLEENQDIFVEKINFLVKIIKEKFLFHGENVENWISGFDSIVKEQDPESFNRLIKVLSN